MLKFLKVHTNYHMGKHGQVERESREGEGGEYVKGGICAATVTQYSRRLVR